MTLLHTPPPSFEDDPLEMLRACHDKVRHFAKLSLRLADHVATHGADPQARDAAQAVLRYFDIAAPLHHADEDDDLYPCLLALNDAALTADIQRLSAEHEILADSWQAVRTWLQTVQLGQANKEDPSLAPPDALRQFAQRYQQHAHDEETLIYPHALRLSNEQLSHLGQSMAQRRQN